MKTKTIAIVLMALLVIPLAGYSQRPFNFHAGMALPLGGFANDDAVIDFEKETENCGAAVGFTAGVQMVFPLSEEGLGLFAGLDLSWNAMKKKVRDELKKEIDEPDADITFPNYFNIPISAGLNYKFPVNENTVLFLRLGGLYNIFKMTDLTVTMDNEKATFTVETSKKPGFLAGAGAYLNEKISVNLSYYGMGKHPVKGRFTIPGEEDESFETDKAVGFATITLAYHF